MIEDLPPDVISCHILSRGGDSDGITHIDFTNFVRTSRELWTMRFELWNRLTSIVIDVSDVLHRSPLPLTLPRSLRKLKVVPPDDVDDVDDVDDMKAASSSPLDLTHCNILQRFDCSGCVSMRHLPMFPESLIYLDVSGCGNLFASTTRKQNVPHLRYLDRRGCPAHVRDSLVFPESLATVKQDDLYIPLEFWFCRHSGPALPLVAFGGGGGGRRRRGGRMHRLRKEQKERERTNRNFLDILAVMSADAAADDM